MNIKPYNKSQYAILDSWWKAHNWPSITESLLPSIGFIVWQGIQPLTAGFLYTTNSKFGVVEWVISNPLSDRIERDAALDLLIDQLIKTASELNIDTLFTTTKHAKLIERYKSHEFIIGDEKMTTLIRRVK